MAVFLGLGIAGVVLLVLSLALDGVIEGVFDAAGAVDGMFDGLFSLPVVAGFLSMTGFGGAIFLATTGLGAVPAAATGVVAGVGTGAVVLWFTRALTRDRTDPPRSEDLVGSSGRVVTAIPADGYGEVLLRLAGQPVKLAARSALPVGHGAEVWVESVASSTSVVVRPVDR